MADMKACSICVFASSLDTDDKKHTTKEKLHNYIVNNNYIELVPVKGEIRRTVFVHRQASIVELETTTYLFFYLFIVMFCYFVDDPGSSCAPTPLVSS